MDFIEGTFTGMEGVTAVEWNSHTPSLIPSFDLVKSGVFWRHRAWIEQEKTQVSAVSADSSQAWKMSYKKQ